LHLALSDFLTSNSFARLLTIAFDVLAFILVKIQANEPCGSKYVSWPSRLLTIAFDVLAFILVKIQANEPCGSKYVSWPSKLFKLWSSFFRSNFCGGLF